MRSHLKPYLQWSLVIHCLMFLGLVFYGIYKLWVTPPPKVAAIPTIRVDLVQLPKEKQKIADPMVPVELTPKAKEDPKLEVPKAEADKIDKTEKKAVVKTKPKNKTVSKDTEKLSQSKRDLLKKILNKEKTTVAKPLAKNTVVGNKLSKGESLVGIQALQMGGYEKKIYHKIKVNWQLPSALLNKSHKAEVLVYLDSLGAIQSLKFNKRSSSAAYNKFVEESVRKTEPFPSPPKDLVQYVRSRGVLLKFP